MKDLVAEAPATWLRFIDPTIEGPVVVMDCDLSTIGTEADKVLRVDDPRGPYVVHLVFQSGYERMFPARLLRYNALLTGVRCRSTRPSSCSARRPTGRT